MRCRIGPLAVRAAITPTVDAVDRGQLAQQHLSLRTGAELPIVRHGRTDALGPACFPLLLEAIADGIDVRGTIRGQLLVVARRLVGHRSFSSFFHNTRIRLNLRSIVRGTQSSWAAISSLVCP